MNIISVGLNEIGDRGVGSGVEALLQIESTLITSFIKDVMHFLKRNSVRWLKVKSSTKFMFQIRNNGCGFEWIQ